MLVVTFSGGRPQLVAHSIDISVQFLDFVFSLQAPELHEGAEFFEAAGAGLWVPWALAVGLASPAASPAFPKRVHLCLFGLY